MTICYAVAIWQRMQQIRHKRGEGVGISRNGKRCKIVIASVSEAIQRAESSANTQSLLDCRGLKASQ
jgi:hypothetical protein